MDLPPPYEESTVLVDSKLLQDVLTQLRECRLELDQLRMRLADLERFVPIERKQFTNSKQEIVLSDDEQEGEDPDFQPIQRSTSSKDNRVDERSGFRPVYGPIKPPLLWEDNPFVGFHGTISYGTR